MGDTLQSLQERGATAEEFIEWAMPVADDPSEDSEWMQRNHAALAFYQGWDMARRGDAPVCRVASPEPLLAFQQGQNRVKRGPMVDVKQGNYRVKWCGWPLEACPHSPLCSSGGCKWPEKRWLLTLHWKKHWPFDEGPFRLILAFARDHRRPTVLDLPRGSKLCIEAESRHDDIDYWDGASLVLELLAIASGKSEDQVLRCGLARMVDSTPCLFWSMLLNFIAAKTVVPFPSSPPVTFCDGQDSPIERELRRIEDLLHDHYTGGGTALPITHNTRSSFLHCMLNELIPLPPEIKDERALHTPITECPRWWKAIAKPWNDLFSQLLENPTFVPCYFAATELGCVAAHLGRPCNADHDPGFIAFVLDSITRPRSCLRCGVYSDKLRCPACKRYYCSKACYKADRSIHRSRCLQFQASDAIALHPPVQ